MHHKCLDYIGTPFMGIAPVQEIYIEREWIVVG
jgi:hypothetical protein